MTYRLIKDSKYLTQEQLNGIISRTFNTPDGKKVLEFFDREYSERSSVVKGDPHMTYYNEGQRSVVNLIKYCINGESDE